MDRSEETNQRYNLKINNKDDWDDAVFLVKEKIQELELAVEKLKSFAFEIQIEHEHNS